MGARKILYSEAVREQLQQGVDTMADAVKVTLGPKGRHVMLEWAVGYPHITKDGVKVARFIDQLPDTVQNMGAQMVYQVARKTSNLAGDGTTTVAVLTQAFFQEGCRMLSAGANPVYVKRGIDACVERVVEELKRISQPVRGRREIMRVATISANNDKAMGNMVAEAIQKVGKHGVVLAEEGKGIDTEVEIMEGMHYDRGYLSPHFITDQKRMEVTLDNPYLLLYDAKISSLADLLSLLTQIAKADGPLLVIADDVEGDALTALTQNKLKGQLEVAATRPPGFGDRRRLNLEDIAALTGGRVISKKVGIEVKDVTIADLGRCKQVRIDKDNTFIVGGMGTKAAIDARRREIEAQIKLSDWDYDREQTKKRLARMAGGIAVIRVGGNSEAEILEKKGRLDNALNATSAALEEGIVPGGGTALLRCSKALDELVLPGDQHFGISITRKALEAPLRQIATNAGLNGGAIVQKVKDATNGTGFNAETGQFVDLIKDGVIDPAKVTRTALQHAASVSSTLLTAETLIVDIVKKPPPALENPHNAIPGIDDHMAKMQAMGGPEAVEQMLAEQPDP